MSPTRLRVMPDEPTPSRRYALRTGVDGRRLLLARRAFRAGGFLLRFSGEVVTERPADPALGLGSGRFLRLTATAAAVRHACRPNAVLVDTDREPVLLALRAIRYGEAITYDHATWIAPGDARALEVCRCGAHACRHVVGSVDMLASATRAGYLERGGVPRHLRDPVR